MAWHSITERCTPRDHFVIAMWSAKKAESAAMLRHAWEFVVAVARQWGALATGGFVVALIGVYERLNGRPIAGRLFWIAVIISLLVAFFLVWRKERLGVEGLNELTDTKKHEREKRVQECVDAAVGILKTNRWLVIPFHALSRANAYRLESNAEVVEACKRIEDCGYEHPLRGLEGYVPEGDWLAFLKHVKSAPGVNPDDEADYIFEADKWRKDHGYPEPTTQQPGGVTS
jgi:hypothetical protein